MVSMTTHAGVDYARMRSHAGAWERGMITHTGAAFLVPSVSMGTHTRPDVRHSDSI